MDSDSLKIPKKLIPVKVWVHPDGLVVGEIFVHFQSNQHDGEEEPAEVLNGNDDFFAMRSRSGELRFYNKHAVVRVEYSAQAARLEADYASCLLARLYLMDGSRLEGKIREVLPPGNARLYDYINIFDQRFVRLFLSDQTVTLVSKAYIVRVEERPVDDVSHEFSG
ncbi:hypothetical protein [Ectothiorhodospira lacustris]|uniref:hypothetical protein n=1 Tax=Ectothiorhodospira lacustris TaxID=2899127 RepID=UPI001EE7A9E0|nr:hypothetical protein [Ectothiorhodospira lacustris]MCG5501646.1 hypothetical protein [Ectothiorhodospira lacustris]MCG5509898.1 hypothetical protein [Ectothiorhodospira lacustris]MCG5521151.1 hypothetical protein [Ectothiorhodospira lacustris]